MKPSLQLRVSQSLTLTPQLRQAIKLLTLSTIELQTELAQVLESNPMLEMEDPAPATSADSEVPDWEQGQREDPGNAEGEAAHEAMESLDLDPVDSPFDILDPAYSGTRQDDDEDFSAEARAAEPQGLIDHLLWQIHLSALSPRDRAMAIAIVESLNEDGYLTEPNASIVAAVAPAPVSEAEVEAMRHFVQQLEPPGVASRDLRECLLAQLKLREHPQLELARRIVANHLELLARNDRVRLARELKAGEAELEQAIHLIRHLEPKPGRLYAVQAAEHVVPDVYVVKRAGRWQVLVNHDAAPRLRVNGLYADLLRHCKRDEGAALRGQLQEARWLLKSLEQRERTVQRVAEVIVERQQDFLEYGQERMKPLVLREVAEEIGMHESTVSRVTTRKYMHTPRGTLEFKYFFSSHVATKDGGEASSTAIQAMIRKLIEEEQPHKPLSDSALATLLKQRGILVARRTVAKYREGMRIPASHERVRQE